ncbi:GlsB/YeaQ/YmgE family stress response membrane protein [Asticcacaulis sp.]|uniref:GlsB/YeaQ/YmgE family stress response membrane protein n=1 Tax=Asticcacaulis sp. TaxID=1872648 RepID=UPI0026294D26|nr:GlsB/YeaQ/YmgE family stress response membrane protein [Asticcacaulis sp.]
MSEYQLGWVVALVVGAAAGWVVDRLVKSDQSLFSNIILGVVGALVANGLSFVLEVPFSGVLASLIFGLAGAGVLIAGSRLVSPSR